MSKICQHGNIVNDKTWCIGCICENHKAKQTTTTRNKCVFSNCVEKPIKSMGVSDRTISSEGDSHRAITKSEEHNVCGNMDINVKDLFYLMREEIGDLEDERF